MLGGGDGGWQQSRGNRKCRSNTGAVDVVKGLVVTSHRHRQCQLGDDTIIDVVAAGTSSSRQHWG